MSSRTTIPSHAPQNARSGSPRTDVSGPPIDVAIAEEAPLIVYGLRAILSPYADQISITAPDPRAAYVSAVDVTLFDPVTAASEITLDLLLDDPARGRVVMYSFDPPAGMVLEMLGRGCAAFVDKGAQPAELVRVLTSVVDPQRRSDGVPSGRSWAGKEHGLSRREAQMVALIARGLTNEDISDQVDLSINTVKSYIRSAYHKLGITRRPQAVRWGIEHGMDHAVPPSAPATRPRLVLSAGTRGRDHVAS